MPVTRRALLTAAGAASGTALLSACSGTTPATSTPVTLTMLAWATAAEQTAYGRLIARFESANPAIRIRPTYLTAEPSAAQLASRLSGAGAPDVVRIGYSSIAAVAAAGRLLDLSPYFSKNETLAFGAAFWGAVVSHGRPYAVPQSMETSALVANQADLRTAGFAVPSGEPWSVDEFQGVLTALRGTLSAKRYPFAPDWQHGRVQGWLPWLFGAGGRLLTTDLGHADLDTAAERRAVQVTSGFFRRGLVAPGQVLSSTSDPIAVLLDGSAAIASVGSSRLPELTDARFAWDVARPPTDVRPSGALRGGALAGSAGTKHRDAVAAFLKATVAEDAMRTFCAAASVLPTLKTLAGTDLGWSGRSGLSPVFAAQAAAISTADVAQSTVSVFPAIGAVLVRQLDAVFTGGQTTDATLTAAGTGIDAALAS